jgi:carbohydrate-selective porin OprB
MIGISDPGHCDARLVEHGSPITTEASITVDVSTPLRGERRLVGTRRGLLDLAVEIDLSTTTGWPGARARTGFQSRYGRHGSDHVGDAQGLD